MTPDGQRYAVQQDNIVKPKGLDAALLKFTSDKTYSVATIAKYNLLPNKKQWVLLSGFPGEAAGKRKFTAGFRWSRERVLARAEDSGYLKSFINYGYELIYSNLTLPGMSGGPVLDVQGAMVDLNQAIKLQPDYASNYSIRGKLREDLKDFQSAVADLNQAIRLDPNHAQYYQSRSLVHSKMKDFQAAIEDCNQMIKLQPKDASGYQCRGIMHLQAKDFQGAIADFNQAIPLAPDFFTFYSRSLAHFAVKDLKGALADVDQAIKLEPSHTNAYFWRGKLRKELKDCQAEFQSSD